MDDLDRLFIELVDIMRRERPAALKEPIKVVEVHDQLIPYRRVRNPIGFRSNDDYETTLCRLLSGERRYLMSDHDMQESLREGLEEALPDIRRYLIYPETRIWINQEEIPPPGDIRYAPPEVRDQIDWTSVEVEEETDGGPEDRAAVAEAATDGEVETENESPASEASEDAPTVTNCPECGAVVEGRRNYCPICGEAFHATLCAICGSALDAGWRFCPDCGAPRGGRPPA